MKTIKWAAAATSISTGDDAESLVITLRPKTQAVCVQIAWTGTTDGTVKLQVSNDNSQWDDLTGINTSTGGSAGTDAWNISTIGFAFMKLVYTRSSGTGTLSGTWNER